jgi:hypothetical protein
MPPTIRVNLVADSAGFSPGVNRAVADLKRFQSEAGAVQTRIAGMFKSAGGKEFAEQLKLNMTKGPRLKADLEAQLFAATHSAKDVALRTLKLEMNGLREQWKHHEETLTLITKTEAARRAEINRMYYKSYAHTGPGGIESAALYASRARKSATTGGFAAGMSLPKLLGRGTAVGAGVWIAGELVQAAAEAKKAQVSGENMYLAFAKSLPLVGGLVRGIQDLNSALDGSKQHAEQLRTMFGVWQSSATGFVSLSNELRQLQGTSAERIKYEERERELLAERRKIIEDSAKAHALYTWQAQHALAINQAALAVNKELYAVEQQRAEADKYKPIEDMFLKQQREYESLSLDPEGQARAEAERAGLSKEQIENYVAQERMIQNQKRINEEQEKERSLVESTLNAIKSKADIFREYRNEIEQLQKAGKLTPEQASKALKQRMRDLMGSSQDFRLGKAEVVQTRFVSLDAMRTNAREIKLDKQIEELRRIYSELVGMRTDMRSNGGY